MYTGNILINARKFSEIEKIIKNPKPPVGKDLDNLLSFLTTYIFSRQLMYDDTIPPKVLDKAGASMEKLKIIKKCKALPKLSEPSLRNIAAQSLQDATDDIMDQLKGFKTKSWDPIETIDAEKFIEILKKLANEKIENHARDMALEAHHKGQIQGAKLLIAFASQKNASLLSIVSKSRLLVTQKEHFISALINIFRTYLLNNLASLRHGLYSADEKMFDLMERRQSISWSQFLREFHKEQKYISWRCPPGSVVTEAPEFTDQFPLLAISLISSARAGALNNMTPENLFEFADSFIKAHKFKSLHRDLINMYTDSNGDPDTVKRQIENFWQEVLVCGYPIQGMKLRSIIGPKVVSGLIGLYPGPGASFVKATASTGQEIIKWLLQKRQYMGVLSTCSGYTGELETTLIPNLSQIWKNRGKIRKP